MRMYVQVGYTLHELGVCFRESGRREEPEELLTSGLMIVEANLGSGDTMVPSTLDHYVDRHLRRLDLLENTNKLLKGYPSMCQAEVGRIDTNVDELLQKTDLCLRGKVYWLAFLSCSRLLVS